jgi:hypothetical protein
MMATAEVSAGICGFKTTIKAERDDMNCKLTISSDCEHINGLAQDLTIVDPYQEISHRGEGPVTLKLAAEHCPHAACPVPAAIIKTIEVESGLALPADVIIKLNK